MIDMSEQSILRNSFMQFNHSLLKILILDLKVINLRNNVNFGTLSMFSFVVYFYDRFKFYQISLLTADPQTRKGVYNSYKKLIMNRGMLEDYFWVLDKLIKFTFSTVYLIITKSFIF